jgi:hypothetical protein
VHVPPSFHSQIHMNSTPSVRNFQLIMKKQLNRVTLLIRPLGLWMNDLMQCFYQSCLLLSVTTYGLKPDLPPIAWTRMIMKEAWVQHQHGVLAYVTISGKVCRNANDSEYSQGTVWHHLCEGCGTYKARCLLVGSVTSIFGACTSLTGSIPWLCSVNKELDVYINY